MGLGFEDYPETNHRPLGNRIAAGSACCTRQRVNRRDQRHVEGQVATDSEHFVRDEHAAHDGRRVIRRAVGRPSTKLVKPVLHRPAWFKEHGTHSKPERNCSAS